MDNPTITISQDTTRLWIISIALPPSDYPTRYPSRDLDVFLAAMQTFEGAVIRATMYLNDYYIVGPNHRVTKPAGTHNPTLSPRAANQQAVSLSDRAWTHLQAQTQHYGYAGHSRTTGCTHYIRALLEANPDPTRDWRDTRPEDLTMYDNVRLHHPHNPRFPYWCLSADTPDSNRKQRQVNAQHWHFIQPMLLELANHFIIAPFRGRQLSSVGRSAAALEAIGLGYLTPRNPPPPNPNPLSNKPDYHYRNKLPWELSF